MLPHLWHRSQHCGSDSIPDLGTSICHTCGQKKKKNYQEYVLALFFLKKEILLLKIKMKSKYRKKKDIIKNTASGGVKY